MAKDLTQRQTHVLREIAESAHKDRRPPSIPELMGRLGVSSPNGVAKHLRALETKGFISRMGGARGIALTPKALTYLRIDAGHDASHVPEGLYDMARVPLLGEIAAGNPILADEHVEDQFCIPATMTDGAGDTFLLRVKGDSMIEEGILPGDLVLVRKSETASNGDLAAVLLEDEATVKRYHVEKDRIVLMPANPAYEPIVVDPQATRFAVIGHVIGLLRSYRTRL